MKQTILYKNVDDIIYQYKEEIEHREKFKKVLDDINKVYIFMTYNYTGKTGIISNKNICNCTDDLYDIRYFYSCGNCFKSLTRYYFVYNDDFIYDYGGTKYGIKYTYASNKNL